ncbi:MAG: Rieske 2Fe-2S domain-containing protein [Caulobacteraceae bacterium]|nr:Rieske 2Fe-2S domain-containing protein [Caulobacteraceae bacterium]
MSFASGIVLARVDALSDPGAIVVTPDPDEPFATVLVTRKGETISAFRNKCPHAGYPLQRSNGRVIVQEGRYMVCAAHGASFGLETGACIGGPCDNGDALERIAIEVRDGNVCVA